MRLDWITVLGFWTPRKLGDVALVDLGIFGGEFRSLGVRIVSNFV